jgi:hypothetical protein
MLIDSMKNKFPFIDKICAKEMLEKLMDLKGLTLEADEVCFFAAMMPVISTDIIFSSMGVFTYLLSPNIGSLPINWGILD